ncbi:glycerophosphoryl diester phosphodiesterase [Bacillus oleivorans]|uniref:Glycerophosphoryl diester phosphodiesterase n=1 Tax=Bacillus oleivorans TaxID=1448271 RepID=A0A285D5R3_9BACI|nr:glycerophosphodiester phosphodiesterase [Bacillus oleivorans]SNX74503.1 glycerophosphoryl diester phosphodiesterase [Bacillus oleivorans]
MSKTLIFAHRGSKGTHPENTLAAFQKAIDLGVDGIELDVHVSKDGELVVIHDETVDRTTSGTGRIRDLTLAEIKQLDAGSWFSSVFSDERIPTLEEVLEILNGTDILINIEIKSDIIPYENIEEKVLNAIKNSGLNESQFIISSFNHYSLEAFKKLAPQIETAILFMEILLDPWQYAANMGASALHVYEPVAFTEMAQRAMRQGFPVRVFTVNSQEHMKALMDLDLSAIMTDFPEDALKIRESLN